MRTLRFQTRLPTGQVEQLNIESERVLIGSGAHCEIRLPQAEARVEHVLIELGPAGVFARALNFEPPPTINNVPFTQAPLPPGAMLGITGTQIYIEVLEGANQPGAPGAEEKKKSPVMLIALLLMLPAGGYLFLGGDDVSAEREDNRPQPPELWGPPVNQCARAKDRNEAVGYARERMGLADAKRERRPFHVQDGIAAVPLYEAAAACFRAGADPASGQLAEESAKYLRREMTDDFRMRRVRLDHALSIDDFSSAQREVRILLQFVEGKQGEYVTWLSNLERKLKLKIGELKENK
ncbi:MAG: hypothetical protein KIT84_30885 [Labilithrix sp.]|nr:hypothetical protein [Labilithrix sp.]MCW5815474.1 hypothetical protein [Labilithrix sp.]